jgi:hypothetical protein
VGVFLYMPRVFWIAVPLGFVSILLFLFAHRAKVLNIRWLYATDILMSNVIAVIAVLTLAQWNVTWFTIAGILCIESLVYSAIVLIEKDVFLFQCGQVFFYLFSIVLIIINFIELAKPDLASIYRNAVFIFICMACMTVYHIFSVHRVPALLPENTADAAGKKRLKFHNMANGITTALFLIPVYLNLRGNLPWTNIMDAEYLLLIPVSVLIFIRQKIQSRGLRIGLLVSIIVVHITACIRLTDLENYIWFEKLIYTAPLFIMDSLIIIFSFVKHIEKNIVWPGIYLLNILFFGLSYFIFEPLSPLIPGVAWLILSVAALETGRLLRDKYRDEIAVKGSPDIHLLRAGYFYLASFLLRHILVHLQSERYIWLIKARFLIEGFALLVFLYWAFSKKPEGKNISKSYTILHPLFPELITLFAILTAAVEVRGMYLPIVWIVFGIVSLFIGIKWNKPLSRFVFYSLFLYWASVIHVAFLTSPLVTPSFSVFGRTWIFSLAAIIIQFAYIIYFYKKADMESVTFPLSFNWMVRLCAFTDKRKNLLIYYPLFISIALFLIWSFDRSILTLLISLEFFLIFVISIILRENHFRYLSLFGLVVCVIRLVVYDLASSNIFIKAIVCIGVGALLLGMNALYGRFRGRYKE